MDKKGFTACQIKDLSSRFAPNGGSERLRLDGFAHTNPSTTSTPSVGSVSLSQAWLSSPLAFTLAEVLITLAIIGVVAALTIPSVIINYQKTQVETQLRKVYSNLSNTTNLAIAAEGPISGWSLYDYSVTVPGTSIKGSEHFAKNYLIPYLKVSKLCGLSTTGICSYKSTWMNGLNLGVFESTNYYKFILNDGTNIALITYDFIYTDNKRYVRGEIFIDLNGSKKPNIVGKDIHEFLYFVINGDIALGKLSPWGSGVSIEYLISDPTWGCNKTSTNRTEYCTAAIMKNGWKIPQGYPW